MTRRQHLASLLAITGLSVCLLGEDVEHQPVEIKPPAATRPPRVPPADAPPPVAEPPAPDRPRLACPTGRRLDLELELEFDPQLASPPTPPSEAEVVKKRIDGYFRDLIAERRVHTGNVDPGWHYLARRMDAYFVPTFSQVGDPAVTEVSGPWLARLLRGWLGGWYHSAHRTRSDGFTPVAGDPYQRVDTTMLEMHRMAMQGETGSAGITSRITTLIEVRVGTGGTLDARMVASSGHPRFDRAALAAVRRAVRNPIEEELPPGPSRSIYALTARYTIMPPLPVVGFSFDFLLGHFDLVYPFKKMVSGQARLVAVYRGSSTP